MRVARQTSLPPAGCSATVGCGPAKASAPAESARSGGHLGKGWAGLAMRNERASARPPFVERRGERGGGVPVRNAGTEQPPDLGWATLGNANADARAISVGCSCCWWARTIGARCVDADACRRAHSRRAQSPAPRPFKPWPAGCGRAVPPALSSVPATGAPLRRIRTWGIRLSAASFRGRSPCQCQCQ